MVWFHNNITVNSAPKALHNIAYNADWLLCYTLTRTEVLSHGPRIHTFASFLQPNEDRADNIIKPPYA